MKSILLLAFFLAALSVASASTCVSRVDNLKQGANCGGMVGCGYGLYCDKTSICSPWVAVGASCDPTFDMCNPTSTCKGAVGSTVCVQNANPGEACDQSSTASLGTCQGSCVSQRCLGGQVGDSCNLDSDCITNLTCSSNICTGLPDGSFCLSSSQCKPTSTCLSLACTPKISTGDCKLSSDLCLYPSFCLTNPNTNTSTCTAALSLNPGDYCGESPYFCKSPSRCVNNYCSKQGLDTPCSNGGCAVDQVCKCGGSNLYGGYGNCASNSCWDVTLKYYQCVSTSCGMSSPDTYTKACVYTYCNDARKNYIACSPANALSGSFFLASVFAIFAIFISKF